MNYYNRNKKYKTLFSNTLIFAISTVLSKLILALLLPLYTRKLTTAEYGTAELLTTISQLVIPVCSFAIQDAVFRFSMGKDRDSSQVLKIGYKVLCIADLLLVFISLAFHWYKSLSSWNVYFFIISVLTMYRSVLSLYVKAIGKSLPFAIDVILYNGSLAGLNILFLTTLNLGLNGYFLAMIIANLISMAYLAINADIIAVFKAQNNRLLLKEMLYYSAPLIINSISWGLTHVADKVMLTEMESSEATGVYSVASKIPSILSLITGVFSQAWTISAIQDYQSEKDSKFYKNIFDLTHISTILGGLAILAFNNNLLPYFVGDDFREAFKYSPILLLGTVFLMYSNFYSPIYSAMMKSKQIMYSALGGAVLNLITNAILIPLIGIMGACIATAASYAFIVVFRMINIRKYMKIDFDIIKFIISIITYLLATIITVCNIENGIPFVSAISIVIIILLYCETIKKVTALLKNKFSGRKIS